MMAMDHDGHGVQMASGQETAVPVTPIGRLWDTSKRDPAIAWGWFTIVLFLVVVILYYVLMVPMYNALTNYANQDIEEGMFSEQAVFSMQWNLGLFSFGVPFFGLIGIFIYGLIRAIERKDYDY